MLHIDLIEDLPSPIAGARFTDALTPLLIQSELPDTVVEVLTVGDARMHQLNRQHRGIDATTDVLSLPTAFDTERGSVLPDLSTPRSTDVDLGAQDDKPPLHLGTIVINIEQAKRQVGKFGDNLEGEILELAGHGLRHLFGHDHDDEGTWRAPKGDNRQLSNNPKYRRKIDG